MDQRTTSEGFHGAHADAVPTTPSAEKKPYKFSELAKQSTLAMLREMIDRIQPNGFIQAWPSFESMTLFHAEAKSDLIDDPDVMKLINQLVKELRLRTDAYSEGHLTFIENHYSVDPVEKAQR